MNQLKESFGSINFDAFGDLCESDVTVVTESAKHVPFGPATFIVDITGLNDDKTAAT
jgi:hypothetical protein